MRGVLNLFKNKYGELRCAWSIILVLVAMFFAEFFFSFAYYFFSYAFFGDGMYFSDTAMQVEMILMELLIFAVVLFLFRIVFRRDPSRMGLSFKGLGGDFFAGVVLGTVCISAVALITVVTGYGSMIWVGFTSYNTRHILLDFILHLTVGLSEETLARGYLMTVSKTTRSRWFIISVSGIIFGLLHIMNSGVTVLSLVNIAIIGVVFAFMFLKRGSIWMPVGFHFIWNFLQGSLYGSAVSGLDVRSLINLTQVGPDIFTGGEFGFEGSIFTTIVTVLCLLAIIFIYPKSKYPQWIIEGDLPLN